MCNVVLCAVAVLFSAVLINGAEMDHMLKYSSASGHGKGGRSLIYDQVAGWDSETVVEAVGEKLPRGVVSDGRFRRAAQMPSKPEMPQAPQGMPQMPQAPQGMPSPPSPRGMP